MKIVGTMDEEKDRERRYRDLKMERMLVTTGAGLEGCQDSRLDPLRNSFVVKILGTMDEEKDKERR